MTKPTPAEDLPPVLRADDAGAPPPAPAVAPQRAALLARLLAESMMAGVQMAATLNRSAADALLAQARLTVPIRFVQLDGFWHSSWRGFELQLRVADRIVGLAHEHVERSTGGLAHVCERLLSEMTQLHASQRDSLRQAFALLREAQQAYLNATRKAQALVVDLARATPQPQPEGDSDGL